MSTLEPSVYKLDSHEETQRFAETLGRLLSGGELFALQGDLGAGKTCFVQGLAKGLDVPESVYVRSPTFALVDEYPGRFPLFHLDLYRLEDEDQLEAIGWREFLNENNIIAVEWANRIPEALPSSRIDIDISINDDDTRTFTVTYTKSHQQLQERLNRQWQIA